jgi:hypothetical protein
VGVGELLAEKEARAKRNVDLFGQACQVVLTLLVLAGWAWTLYLAFLASCEVGHHESQCADRTWSTVRVGVVTVLVTFARLWQVAARRIRRLEDELAERD